jgi:7-cyano-7-deazaguanine reductase
MKKLWDKIDGKLLKSIPNPASGYEQYIDIPEFTFMGVHNQPDFGHIKIWFHGEKSTVELKKFKRILITISRYDHKL